MAKSVDVLAVMGGLADFLAFKSGPSESVEIVADARVAVAEPIEALRQADSQMLMAADCIENRRYDEALLHVCSLRRQRIAALARCTGEGA